MYNKYLILTAIILLLPGMAFTGISFFGETLLSAVKKTNILALTLIVAAMISIILNYRLIAIMNLYGAVITVVKRRPEKMFQAAVAYTFHSRLIN